MRPVPDYPAALARGECAVVRFVREWQEDGCLQLDDLLGMRRPLRQAAAALPDGQITALFDPAPGSDPEAVRRFQKPAPGFTVLADPRQAGPVRVGDRLPLDVLFLGTAIPSIGDLLTILQRLGEFETEDEQPRFTVVEACSLDLDGRWQPFWPVRRVRAVPAPGLLRLDHWLEAHWPDRQPVELTFSTPVRLVAGGRLLRRPRFDQLFPFVLRRVTALLYHYCDLDPVDNVAPLLAAARSTPATWMHASWLDWREADNDERLGGVLGTLRLDGEALAELLWVVLLGSLVGVGKGAAYGAGRFKMEAVG